MIARLRSLVRVPDVSGLKALVASRVPGRFDRFSDFGRPAAVLGAMIVASLFIVMFGEGSSAAATDPSEAEAVVAAAGESSDGDRHGAEATAEATAEHSGEESSGHSAEATVEATDEQGDEGSSGHGAEATAEATAEHDGEATGQGAEPTAVATFQLAATATPSAGAVQWTDFVSTQFDVSFKYEVAPDGFALQQTRTPDEERAVTWLLTRGGAAGLTPSGSPPEGMSIEVYVPSPFPEDAEAWVRSSPHAHFGAGLGDLTAATVGGAHGVRYDWAGPTEAISVVVPFDGRIWVFSSNYREVSVGAFDVLLDSVVFWK